MTVEYDRNNLIERQTAYIIRRAFSRALGEELGFDRESRDGETVVRLCYDGKLKKGSWRLSVEQGRISCFASSYYGYLGIAEYIESGNAIADAEGSYLDFIDELGGSTRYAYDKRGELRLMFYNVLFYRPAPDLRNILNAEVVDQYRPDVLGCQEFNGTKRGDFIEYGPAIATHPHADLSALLAKIGYKETLPRDVGVHPFYNNTPLFYNTKTTKLIKSAYFWYKNQIDDENRNNCGWGDCASKSATWGVFEDKKSGKRYIVISTHMCTRSDGVRGLQAIEIVDFIKELVAKYNCPVFLGGDYNGLPRHANYRYFVSDKANYIDVALNGVAKEYASTMRTHHTYPLYNKELDIELIDPNDNTNEAEEYIDHIMMTNSDNVKINVYGVVVDECSMSGSDHYPIFADFDF